MVVQVNGMEVDLPDGSTIEGLLRLRRLPLAVVVELNGDIVDAANWRQTSLNPGDRLEVVELVAGG